MQDAGERIALGFVEAERQRRANVEGAELVEIDGLLLAFATVLDPPVNSVLVISEPSDPPAALAAAEAEFRERDRVFGMDVAVGRHPSVDRAVRSAGLSLLFSWSAMAARVDELPERSFPEGVRVEPVSDARGAAAFVACEGDEPVGIASAHLRDGAVGIFGVGVVPSARRRGIASALSVIAARAFPADLAWLHASDDAARSVYERLGFREVAEWEVWVRSG